MAQLLKSFTFSIHLLLLANYLFFATDARILNVLKPISFSSRIESYVEGLSLGAIKNSGPTPGVNHHKCLNVQTIGGIKDSGRSPGDGHKYVDVETLGGVKESGPSPGSGHHKFTRLTQALGGVKESGPSPGNGHSFVTNIHH